MQSSLKSHLLWVTLYLAVFNGKTEIENWKNIFSQGQFMNGPTLFFYTQQVCIILLEIQNEKINYIVSHSTKQNQNFKCPKRRINKSTFKVHLKNVSLININIFVFLSDVIRAVELFVYCLYCIYNQFVFVSLQA